MTPSSSRSEQGFFPRPLFCNCCLSPLTTPLLGLCTPVWAICHRDTDSPSNTSTAQTPSTPLLPVNSLPTPRCCRFDTASTCIHQHPLHCWTCACQVRVLDRPWRDTSCSSCLSSGMVHGAFPQHPICHLLFFTCELQGSAEKSHRPRQAGRTPDSRFHACLPGSSAGLLPLSLLCLSLGRWSCTRPAGLTASWSPLSSSLPTAPFPAPQAQDGTPRPARPPSTDFKFLEFSLLLLNLPFA